MNLNDLSKWLQIKQRVKTLRVSEYFMYPLYTHCDTICLSSSVPMFYLYAV